MLFEIKPAVLSIVMLSIIMLSVVKLKEIMLTVVILSIIMRSVVKLKEIMLSVVMLRSFSLYVLIVFIPRPFQCNRIKYLRLIKRSSLQ